MRVGDNPYQPQKVEGANPVGRPTEQQVAKDWVEVLSLTGTAYQFESPGFPSIGAQPAGQITQDLQAIGVMPQGSSFPQTPADLALLATHLTHYVDNTYGTSMINTLVPSDKLALSYGMIGLAESCLYPGGHISADKAKEYISCLQTAIACGATNLKSDPLYQQLDGAYRQGGAQGLANFMNQNYDINTGLGLIPDYLVSPGPIASNFSSNVLLPIQNGIEADPTFPFYWG